MVSDDRVLSFSSASKLSIGEEPSDLARPKSDMLPPVARVERLHFVITQRSQSLTIVGTTIQR